MKSVKVLLSIGLCLMVCNLSSQTLPLAGTRICLDPGHGGHDADDRPTELGVGQTYYESDANWDAVMHLESLLSNLGAEVKITKSTNDPEAPDRDPSLADRVQVANAFQADYFHSFHTNGFSNPETNYSLVLYAGEQDGQADFPEALEMSDIMSEEIFKFMRTTTTFSRADIPFTGFMNGLGVLNNLSMPGTLSEVSFHSNIDEGRRLLNSDYLKSAAWGITKSFLLYFEQPLPENGELGGIVTDLEGNPLNSIEITFSPGTADEQQYVGDQFLNGFYFFDSISPGDYEVLISKPGYEAQIRAVTIHAGENTTVDASLTIEGGPPNAPTLLKLTPNDDGQGVIAEWVKNPEVNLAGYRLYYAEDDDLDSWELVADETVLSKMVTGAILLRDDEFLVPPDQEAYHFRLTAVSESGAESKPSDIYSRLHSSYEEQLLIVDGFDRVSGSFKENTHFFTANYLTAIRKANQVNVGSIANDYLLIDTNFLLSYDAVLWYLGDESTADITLSKQEQHIISKYLDAGGKLIISGSEIGWDLDNLGNETDRTFYRNYLKAQYRSDGSSSYSPVQGAGQALFDEVLLNLGFFYEEDFPDEISPIDGAEALLRYNIADRIAGIGYRGIFADEGGEGGVVHLGFAIETARIEEQEQLIRKSLVYLDVGTEISSLDEKASTPGFQVTLSPNPGSNELVIEIETDFQNVAISITNANGQELYRNDFQHNAYPKRLRLTTTQWPSGTYFISISTERFLQSYQWIKQ